MLFMTLLMCALVFAGCSSDGSDNGGGDPAELRVQQGDDLPAGKVKPVPSPRRRLTGLFLLFIIMEARALRETAAGAEPETSSNTEPETE